MCINWLYPDIGVILHILQLSVIKFKLVKQCGRYFPSISDILMKPTQYVVTLPN